MRTSFKIALSAVLFLPAIPAFAQEAAEEPADLEISGNATVVTDYRFRGLSQTNKRPAVQGGITVTHGSGLYGAVWGSTVDDYIAAGADQEIDLSIGLKKTTGGATIDAGVVYYYYPGAEQIIPGYNSDFAEAYGSVSYDIGPATAKLAVAYAPKQSALDYGTGKVDNFYGSAEVSVGVPNTPVTLSGKIGRNFSRSFLSSGVRYTDWSLGASFSHKALSFGVTYVDTNKAIFSGLPGANRNISKGGVFASFGVSF